MNALNNLIGKLFGQRATPWADSTVIRQQGLLPGYETSGVVVGAWEGKPLIDTSMKPVAVLGPCRSGKGTSVLVPSLLTWQQSAVVFDIKGELHDITAHWRQKGLSNSIRQIRFDDEASPDTYNFLEAIRRDAAHELDDIQALAASLVPDSGGDAFWISNARALLTLFIIAQRPNTNASLADVLGSITSDDGRTAVLNAYRKYATDEAIDKTAEAIATTFCELNGNAQDAIITVVASALSPFASPSVAKTTARSSFSLADVLDGPEPTSLYVTVMPHELQRLKPLLHAFFAQVFRHATHGINSGVSRRVLLVLDEITSLGRIPLLEDSLAYLSGYGIKPLLAFQSLSQLEQVYGPRCTIWPQCGIRTFFAPNQIATAEALSKELGDIFANSGSSANTVPVLNPDELLRLERHGAIILGATSQPIYTVTRPYYDDPQFKRRVDPTNNTALKAATLSVGD